MVMDWSEEREICSCFFVCFGSYSLICFSSDLRAQCTVHRCKCYAEKHWMHWMNLIVFVYRIFRQITTSNDLKTYHRIAQMRTISSNATARSDRYPVELVLFDICTTINFSLWPSVQWTLYASIFYESEQTRT